jgi:assimilatory nitrate reductase catalytic subunit
MIICICEGVNDRDVRRIVSQGACNLSTLKRLCGAGGDCGACRPQLRRMIRETPPAESKTSGG